MNATDLNQENELPPEPGPARGRRPSRSGVEPAPPPTALSQLRQFAQRLPLWVWGLSAFLTLLAWFTPDRYLTMFATALPVVLIWVLWLEGEPPALLFACLLQWLQAGAAVFYANLHGTSVARYYQVPEYATASWLSLISVLMLALGMRLASGKLSRDAQIELNRQMSLATPSTLFTMYLIAFGSCLLLLKLSLIIAPLRQPIAALGTLRWVLSYLLCCSVLRQGRGYALLVVMIVIEMLLGFMSYFSGFRNVFSILIVAMATAKFLFRVTRVVQVAVVTVVLVVLCVYWTAVKADYRDYLNQGSGMQVVKVSGAERIKRLRELVQNVNQAEFADALDKLMQRISYVQFFALTIANVPSAVGYEHGQLWLGAVRHTLMPRLFFRNKASINDSDRTEKYTGMKVAGYEDGTSISIGYIGESYIDFGPYGMMFPVFLLGMAYGGMYRFFIRWRGLQALGAGAATALLAIGAYNIETSNIKLFGGNVTTFLALAAFLAVFGRMLWDFMTSNPVLLRSPRRAPRRTPHGARP